MLEVALKAARGGEGEGHFHPSSSWLMGEHLKMWQISFRSIQLQRIIGEGSYGRVYLGTWQGTPVAVKILLYTALDACNEEAMTRALTLSNPVLANLSKVCVGLAERCTHCVFEMPCLDRL